MVARVIDGLDGLRAMVGQSLGRSEPVQLTQESIHLFCAAVRNDGWMHLDVERAKASRFGNTIAPSMLTLAYFSTVFQQMVDIVNVPNMMLLGADRIRLLRPLVCDASFTVEVAIDRIEEKKNGFSLFLDTTWNAVGQEQPIVVAEFVMRCMEN